MLSSAMTVWPCSRSRRLYRNLDRQPALVRHVGQRRPLVRDVRVTDDAFRDLGQSRCPGELGYEIYRPVDRVVGRAVLDRTADRGCVGARGVGGEDPLDPIAGRPAVVLGGGDDLAGCLLISLSAELKDARPRPLQPDRVDRLRHGFRDRLAAAVGDDELTADCSELGHHAVQAESHPRPADSGGDDHRQSVRWIGQGDFLQFRPVRNSRGGSADPPSAPRSGSRRALRECKGWPGLLESAQ